MFEKTISDAESSLSGEATRPSLMATNGAPGSGKSFLLDELAAFRPEDVTRFASEKRRSYFRKSNVLALNVTFNSDLTIIDEFDTSIQWSLSIRVLFQYVPLLVSFYSCIVCLLSLKCMSFADFHISEAGISAL